MEGGLYKGDIWLHELVYRFKVGGRFVEEIDWGISRENSIHKLNQDSYMLRSFMSRKHKALKSSKVEVVKIISSKNVT